MLFMTGVNGTVSSSDKRGVGDSFLELSRSKSFSDEGYDLGSELK